MRVFLVILSLFSLSACYAHTDRGSVHVDGLGGASWGDSHHHYAKGGKGCPPGLAKQGRCY